MMMSTDCIPHTPGLHLARALAPALLLLSLAIPASAAEPKSCADSTGDDAIAACTRIIELGGASSRHELAVAYENRGIARGGKGDLDGALADFTRVIELDPKNANGCYNRGLVKTRKGDLDGALADLTCAIELDPQNSDAYTFRSVTKGVKGDFVGALADASRAIELDPQNSNAYTFRSAAKYEKGDMEGAIADANRAIELNPKQTLAYMSRGKGKLDKGDFDGALADFNRAIELDPKRTVAYLGRGRLKLGKGDLDGALADFSRAIEIDPQDGNYFKTRGRAYFLNGDYAAAVSDLAHAQQNKPDAYGSLWLYLARTHTKAEGKSELIASVAKLDRNKWPAPLLEFYQGRGTPESLRTAAKNPDPKTQSGQVCEVNFYLAEWLLLGNDSKGARPLLEDAARNCPKNFVEYDAAAFELKRIAGK
jgi:lipoprotein NlpI